MNGVPCVAEAKEIVVKVASVDRESRTPPDEPSPIHAGLSLLLVVVITIVVADLWRLGLSWGGRDLDQRGSRWCNPEDQSKEARC